MSEKIDSSIESEKTTSATDERLIKQLIQIEWILAAILGILALHFVVIPGLELVVVLLFGSSALMGTSSLRGLIEVILLAVLVMFLGYVLIRYLLPMAVDWLRGVWFGFSSLWR